MATLNIGGQRIKVGDQFLTMTPEQQQAAVDEIAATLGMSGMTHPLDHYDEALADASARSRIFDHVAEPSRGVEGGSDNVQITGLLNNIGAGIDSGANMLLGAPVDLPVWLGNSVINATNSGIEMATGDRPIPNIPTDLPGSSESWERTQEKLGFTPPSRVVPTDDGQRLARAGAEAITMAAVPEAAMVRAGQVAQQLPRGLQQAQEAAGALFGQSNTAGQFARNMTTNAAAAGAAQAAADAAPDELKPVAAIAAGLSGGVAAHGLTGIPGAVKTGARVADDYLAPLTTAGRERMAGDILAESATDAAALREALEAGAGENIPGSQPTTFQATGDMGIGALERAAAAKNPAAFNQRRADQNAAQVSAIEALQPTGSPEAVSNALRAQLEQIDADTYERVSQVTEGARRAATAVGRGQSPEVAGQAIRESLENARSAAKERETAIWAAVDPDGSLALSPAQTKAAAKQILDDTPASARQASGEERAIYDLVGKYGETIPLRELSALHSRVKDEMRALRTMGLGESAGYRRLTQLNQSVFADLNEAVVAKVVQEQDAVAKGLIGEMDTIAAKLLGEIREFGARKAQTGTVSAVGAAGATRGGPSGFSRPNGAEVSGRGRFGDAPSDPRLSGDGLTANFDDAALERLNEARDTTQARVNRFDNNLLKPIRQRPSTQSPYDMQAASVPGRIFHAGAKSFDDIQTYRRAVGDRVAMPQLQAYAIDRLRAAAMREDGTIDPAKLASWRRQHVDALRAFPALDQKLATAGKASEAMADVATSRKLALEDAQKGALGRLIGAEDPQDIVRTVGAIFTRQDSAAQMQRIVQMIGDNPEARAGLKKSIVEYVAGRFIGNTEAATSGLGTIKSDAYQTFFRQNTNALRLAGFSSDQLDTMAAIAKDLQQTNRSIASVKLPGGSNTAQDTFAIGKTDNAPTILAKMIGASAVTGGATGLVLGPMVGVPVGAGTAILGAFRQAGIQRVDDLVEQAMLNPPMARLLLQNATKPNLRLVEVNLAQMLRRATAMSLPALSDN